MELIRGLGGLRPRHRPCVATIGAFDGVHRGHRVVVAQLRAQAQALGLPATVVTFEPQPREYLQPQAAPARLTTLREKCELLAAAGVDRLLCVKFDERLRRMNATDFAMACFVDGLAAQVLILGDDFRFGRDRGGDAALMREIGAKHGFRTLATDTVEHDGERISSTRLRAALADSDFALAQTLLGRPFTLSGRVIHGRELGRELGTPTANIALHRLSAPLSGVYAVSVDGAGLHNAQGVANIGTRPTVDSSTRATLEVHLLEGSPELYGQRLVVRPLQRVRAEQRFESVEALRTQIEQDKAAVRQFFAGAGEQMHGDASRA